MTAILNESHIDWQPYLNKHNQTEARGAGKLWANDKIQYSVGQNTDYKSTYRATKDPPIKNHHGQP